MGREVGGEKWAPTHDQDELHATVMKSSRVYRVSAYHAVLLLILGVLQTGSDAPSNDEAREEPNGRF